MISMGYNNNLGQISKDFRGRLQKMVCVNLCVLVPIFIPILFLYYIFGTYKICATWHNFMA